MSLSKSEKEKLNRYNLKGVNKPQFTPSHPKKKAVVAVRSNGGSKIIRFGQKGYKHNYSDAARKSFKARFRRQIAKGPSSAAYWANRFLWKKGGSVKKSV